MHIVRPGGRARGRPLHHLAAQSAVLLLAAGLAHATPAQLPAGAADPQAADPQAAVPPTAYRPLLPPSPPAAQSDLTPDRRWVDANATVAAYNAMSLTMKGMDGHAGHAVPAAADGPQTGHGAMPMTPAASTPTPALEPTPTPAHPHEHQHKESP